MNQRGQCCFFLECYYQPQVICTPKFGNVASCIVSLHDHKRKRRSEIIWLSAETEGRTLLFWHLQALTLWCAGGQHRAVLQDDLGVMGMAG